jgi:hypothetical protein
LTALCWYATRCLQDQKEQPVTYQIETLIAADEFVASQRAIDTKLGDYTNAEMSKAMANGTLVEWLKELTA